MASSCTDFTIKFCNWDFFRDLYFFFSCYSILFRAYADILFRTYILHSRKKERKVTFVKISLAKPMFYASPLQ